MVIHWLDIVHYTVKDYKLPVDELVDEPVYRKRLEKFLDFLEGTPEGQQMLCSIQEKYNNPSFIGKMAYLPKLHITLNDNFKSVTFDTGQITIDIRDEQYLAFIDRISDKPMLMPFESIVFHEFFHASDARVEIGVNRKNKDYKTVIEEDAVKATDNFSQKYNLGWGVRGTYENVAGDKPFKILNQEGCSGIDILNNDPELCSKIEEAIRTRDIRLSQAKTVYTAGKAVDHDFIMPHGKLLDQYFSGFPEQQWGNDLRIAMKKISKIKKLPGAVTDHGNGASGQIKPEPSN